MAYTAKKYSRINWKNRPSTATALGATNMNHMDVFLNDVDNALVEMEAAKLNIATANSMLKSVTYNKSTGVWNFRQLDGTSFTFDQNIEKIPVSFSLSESGVLTMTTEDGTQWECNVADLIKDYVFDDSETIGFSKEFKTNEYHVSATVKEGSIESKHLNPDYRADIQSYMNTAQTAANDSLTYSKDSKRWAVGDASYSGSETDNSKYYKEQAESAKVAAEKARDEAQAATGAKIMTPTEMGVGRPDGSTIGVTDGIFGLIAKAINLPAVDTSGIVGTAGEESTTQALLDELASRVVSKLVTNDALTTKLADYMTKSMMSGTQVNDANHVPTSALAYSMNQAIETLNSNCLKNTLYIGTYDQTFINIGFRNLNDSIYADKVPVFMFGANNFNALVLLILVSLSNTESGSRLINGIRLYKIVDELGDPITTSVSDTKTYFTVTGLSAWGYFCFIAPPGIYIR